MGVNGLLFGVVLVSFLTAVTALHCYHCGMYNDGVGSITPCLNETHMKLLECPKRDTNFCIKYINEGSTVRDCVPKCTEREDWGSMTFCCNQDGCNSAPPTHPPFAILMACVLVALLSIAH